MKKYFITGLVILLPVAVTIAIVIFLVDLLTKPFMGWVMQLLMHTNIKNLGFSIFSPEQVIRYGSQIIILIGLFLVILGIGFLGRWFFIKSFFRLSDKLLHKIPLVNKVYKTTQDIIQTLFVTDKNSFKQVVLVPFPSQETFCLGLVSRASPKVCSAKAQEDMVSVFIPTTPNPTTGFLIMYKKQDLIFLDMKTEEAIKYIVSCGVILPGQENKEELQK